MHRIVTTYFAFCINRKMKMMTKLRHACQDGHDIGYDCACEDGKGDCYANCAGDCGYDDDGCGGDYSSAAVSICSGECVLYLFCLI